MAYRVAAVLGGVQVTAAAADEGAVALLVVAPLLALGGVDAIRVDGVGRGGSGVLRAHGTENGGGGDEEGGIQHVVDVWWTGGLVDDDIRSAVEKDRRSAQVKSTVNGGCSEGWMLTEQWTGY